MICPVTQSNWLQTEALKLFLFVSEISHTDSCPESEPSRKGYCHSLLAHCNLAAPLNKFRCWDFPISALSHIFPAPGHGGHVKPGEARGRAACSLCDFLLFFLFFFFFLGENVTTQHFWRYSIDYRAACAMASVLQELPQGTATSLPFHSLGPLPRHSRGVSVHTWVAYKLLIVFLSEASPNSLAFPKQKQIWIGELARKTNSNPALSENTARCHG